MFISRLDTTLEPLHLLLHPFYQSWNDGSLPKNILQLYAREYYHHVAAFPRYISQIHSNCADLKSRQALLGNLIDEEQGEENHPELWLRFAEGLGVTRKDIREKPDLDSTDALIQGFFDLAKIDYPTGIGALYAYERQTPTIAKAKIEGLQKHYNISEEKTLQFFTVHQQADEWHTEELVHLIERFEKKDDEKKVLHGAVKGATLLWSFLDGINECIN